MHALTVHASAGAARAQIGNPAPEFVPVEWINSPSVYLEELRGKAVLIEVFRTWSEECTTQEPGLSARYEKDAARGLVVIGVTGEAPDAVARWVRIHADPWLFDVGLAALPPLRAGALSFPPGLRVAAGVGIGSVRIGSIMPYALGIVAYEMMPEFRDLAFSQALRIGTRVSFNYDP